MIKELLIQTPLFYPVKNFAHKVRGARELRMWQNSGRPSPPPHIVKEIVVKEYAKNYDIKVFVETGTYFGDMVEAVKRVFDKIFSIELSDEFHIKAKDRFKADNNIELILGDSGRELKWLMSKIDQPALFWLDGHYSAGNTARGLDDTPVCKELEYILGDNYNNHVVLIDDARCFGQDPQYPSIDDLTRFINSKRRGLNISVKYDSIRVEPSS